MVAVAGTLTTARGITQSVLALFAGALGDRFHRGRIITAGEEACKRPTFLLGLLACK